MTAADKQALTPFAAACRQVLENLAVKQGAMFQGFAPTSIVRGLRPTALKSGAQQTDLNKNDR